MRTLPVLGFGLVLLLTARARAEEYVVGSGGINALADVPWSTLGAGDIVTIPYRAEPYRETFAITTSGNDGAPITVRGLRGPGGERPVIDGEDAVRGEDTHVRALISLRDGASHVVIEGLELVHAHADYAHDGLFPADNASGLYVEDASHVVVRDCALHGNGNGLFSAPGTSDLRVEGNFIWGNGNVGSTQEHNSYTETDGIRFEGNRYGPLCAGCLGNNLKDRSAGTIIRYNFIEGGNRALDLVEAESEDDDFTARVASTPVFVYGNVLVKRDDTPQSQVVHFGGDNGNTDTYRRALLFYNNTVLGTRATRTTFFHFDADSPVVDVRNCVFAATSSQIYLLDSSTSEGASVALVHDLLPTTWDVSVAAALDAVVTTTNVTTGNAPGFVDVGNLDLHLLPNAPARNGGTALANGAPAVLREYLDPQQTTPRLADAEIDLGAFEVCESDCEPATVPDGGVGEPDGGVVFDAGTGGTRDGGADGSDDADGGCGCSAGRAPRAPSVLLAGLALALVLRRRRD